MLQQSHLQHLADHGFVVIDNFISIQLQDALLDDVRMLRKQSKFQVAKIGHNGQIQDETTPFRDIRYSETCFIGRAPSSSTTTTTTTSTTTDHATVPITTTSISPSLLLPSSVARQELYELMDQIRHSLSPDHLPPHGRHTHDIPKLDNDLEELLYVYYPCGGYYRRHVDAEDNDDDDTDTSTVAGSRGSKSRGGGSHWRKYSLLLYLNPRSWPHDAGGQLRLHRDSGINVLPTGELPNFLDVNPCGGTLVLFRSDLIPHEVLDTQMERIAIVGWFLSSSMTIHHGNNSNETNIHYHTNAQPTASTTTATTTTTTTTTTMSYNRGSTKNNTSNNRYHRIMTSQIHPQAMADLRTLRDTCPRLKAKLEPIPPQQQQQQQFISSGGNHSSSGLLSDDMLFGFPDSMAALNAISTTTTTTTTTARSASTHPAALHDTDPIYWQSIAAFDCQGYITTLSLSGQRLKRPLLEAAPAATPKSDDDRNLLILLPELCRYVVTLDLANTDLFLPLLPSSLSDNNTITTKSKLENNQQNRRNTDDDDDHVVLELLRNVSKENHHRMKQLYLGGNGLKHPGTVLDILATHTSNHRSCLTTLDLRYNDMGPEGVRQVANYLSSPTSAALQILYLEGNQMGDVGIQALALAFTSSSSSSSSLLSSSSWSLRELYLGQNEICPQGAIALARSLYVLSSSSYYSTSSLDQDEEYSNDNNKPHQEEEKMTIMKRGGGLRKLYLEGNRIGNDGARAFIHVLEDLGPKSTLEKLYVDNNGIDKTEAIRLGKTLKSVTMMGDGGLFQD